MFYLIWIVIKGKGLERFGSEVLGCGYGIRLGLRGLELPYRRCCFSRISFQVDVSRLASVCQLKNFRWLGSDEMVCLRNGQMQESKYSDG